MSYPLQHVRVLGQEAPVRAVATTEPAPPSAAIVLLVQLHADLTKLAGDAELADLLLEHTLGEAGDNLRRQLCAYRYDHAGEHDHSACLDGVEELRAYLQAARCGQRYDDAGAPDGWHCNPSACSQPSDCPLNA